MGQPETHGVMRRALDEAGLLLTAAGFLTRLPLPDHADWAPDRMARASRYFPLAGALAGACGGLVFWLAAQALPPSVAAGLALAALIGLTGALHEDGLADCADGLGGGRSRPEVLRIMRDSRTGAYGVIALTLAIGLRWAALAALAPASGVLALAIAGAAGRAMMVPATALASYARSEGTGALVARGAGPVEVAVALGTALALALPGGWGGLAALVMALAAGAGFLWYLVCRIGGYTGDGLGAIAALGEVAAMVMLAGYWA